MPQGYYTIEQWIKGRWKAIQHLPFGRSLTAAEEALATIGEPGLYRIVQMQRVVWVEKGDGGVRLRKSHASSPASLDGIRKMFEESRGRYPVERVHAARQLAKRKRGAVGREQ
jgi:hypothetical protein